MALSPRWVSSRLIRENGRLPKNPRYAESGEGCGAERTMCRSRLISICFFPAGLPQRTKTSGLGCSSSFWITWSVKLSQPLFRWEFAWLFWTVNTVFNKKTPCLAQGVRFPVVGVGIFRSADSSLKIFLSEGGSLFPSSTEKLNPCAWLGPW